MKTLKSLQPKILATFLAALIVFLYLLLAPPLGALAEISSSMLVALFRFGPEPSVLAVFAFRCAVLYLGAYGLFGLLFSLWQNDDLTKNRG